MNDCIQVFQQKGGRAPGFRFRVIKDDEPIYISAGSYVDRIEATRVAKVVNKRMFASAYPLRSVSK